MITRLSDEVGKQLLTLCACQQYGLSIPVDYIKLSLRGMQRLKDAGRFNVIYGLAKGLGTDRPDGSGPCFLSCLEVALAHVKRSEGQVSAICTCT